MKVYFWGTRGSLPASATSKMIETKIFQAIQVARSYRPETDEEIQTFIRQKLPFTVRGSYGGNTACVELAGGREYILCDAGTGLRDFGTSYMQAKAEGLNDFSNVFHIFISHLHWDHVQGFPFFVPAFVPGNTVHIYGCHENLEQAFISQQNAPGFPVPLTAMKADIRFHVLRPGESYDIADMKVTGIRQNHPGDSYGYSFAQDGKKVVYSTDAEHKESAINDDYEFIGFFRDADLLIFDAQYSFLDAVQNKENWGHSSNVLAVELAVRAGVRRLCLFHNEHTYDDETLDRFLKETCKYLQLFDKESPLQICLAYDGLEIII